MSNWQYADEIKYDYIVLRNNKVEVNHLKRYRKMIETVLATDGVYFSYTYDLTHSFQRISEMKIDPKSPLWTRVSSDIMNTKSNLN